MIRFSEEHDVALAALIAISQALEPITKSSSNPHYNSRYADYAALMHIVQPLLLQNDCVVLHHYSPLIQHGLLPIDGPVMFTRLLHKSGEWVETFVPYAVQDATNPQKHGSAQTYAKRYGLTNLLNIVTDNDDDDGNDASGGGSDSRPEPAKRRGESKDEHGVRKMESKYDNKCSMCGGQIKGKTDTTKGEAIAWKSGKPAVHWACYESWRVGGGEPQPDPSESAPYPDEQPTGNEPDLY